MGQVMEGWFQKTEEFRQWVLKTDLRSHWQSIAFTKQSSGAFSGCLKSCESSPSCCVHGMASPEGLSFIGPPFSGVFDW